MSNRAGGFRIGRRAAVLLLALFLVGCGGPRVVNVKGKVTYKGEPVPGANVFFTPDNGRGSMGHTDDKGEFILHYERDRDGAMTGTHKVHIAFPQSRGDEVARMKGVKVFKDVDAVLKKYGDPQKPALTYEITTEGQFIEVKLD
jgi:hypothetical protein